MQIKTIQTSDKKEVNRFIRFPFELYKGNPYWVPPLQGEMESVMNRQTHPFYTHSNADFFTVEDNGKTLGRIAVLKNENFCKHHQAEVAFFYYFDCVDDLQVSQMLFDAASEWARSHTATLLMGPKGFLRSAGQGLLVEGFDVLPAMGIPYNLSYYARLIEAAGFEKETDHVSGYLNHHLTPKLHQAADRVLARGQFSIKKFNSRKDMISMVPIVDYVHKKAFENNPGFYPSTPEEFDLIAKNIIAIADPRMIKIIMHNGDVAGFVVAYRNINQAIQKTKGRLYPFGWMTLLNAKRTAKTADLNGLGLLPEYQGLGGNVLLYSEVEKVLASSGMVSGEIVQVDERNFRSRSDMEFMEVIWNKRHRTYKKSV